MHIFIRLKCTAMANFVVCTWLCLKFKRLIDENCISAMQIYLITGIVLFGVFLGNIFSESYFGRTSKLFSNWLTEFLLYASSQSHRFIFQTLIIYHKVESSWRWSKEDGPLNVLFYFKARILKAILWEIFMRHKLGFTVLSMLIVWILLQ